MSHQLSLVRAQVDAVDQRLKVASPASQISQLKQDQQALSDRLNRDMQQDFQQQKQRLAELVQSLDYLSPLKIMGRGYSYVTSHKKKSLPMCSSFTRVMKWSCT